MVEQDGVTQLAELRASAIDAFLRYVRIETTSDARSSATPSTPGQWELLRLLHEELANLGYRDATIDQHGYVTASLPANCEGEHPTVAFFAHVDTSIDAPGKNVVPVIWKNYDGGTISLPADPTQQLSPAVDSSLQRYIGHDLITSDGTTLLGADDKAGVAAIMATAAYLQHHPEVRHGNVRFVFNPDEEIGRGVELLNLSGLGAHVAYTLDAGSAGEIENETFSADSMTVTFHGRSAHPGYAKDKLVNAVKVASEFVSSLPPTSLSPETTELRQGYVHPTRIEGAAELATVHMIVRDFATDQLAVKEALIERLAEEAVRRHPGARVEFRVTESYRNMLDVLKYHPRVTEIAEEAARSIGLTPVRTAIRGGTDGARLTAMGLPAPNLFAGWHMPQSRREWVAAQDIALAAQLVVELATMWSQEPLPGS